MPNIESDFFAGKPIKMNGQEGFVCENQTPGNNKRVTIKIKGQSSRATVS